MFLADPAPSAQTFFKHPRVAQTRRTLRIVWFAIVGAMSYISYVIYHKLEAPLVHSNVLVVAAIAIALTTPIAPRWLNPAPRPGANPLAAHLDTIMVQAILRFALSEAALTMLLISFPQYIPALCGAGLALMAMHFPRDAQFLQFTGDVAATNSSH